MPLKYLRPLKEEIKVEVDHRRAHLTHALNHVTHKAIRWCTPSIDQTFSQVKDPYASDTSTSFESLGYPADPSGIFKKMYDHAAEAYGADHTLFSVNGSTGSNFMVLRALSKQIPNLRILSMRNVHRSIVVACEDYGINLLFLQPNIDQTHQLFLPNTKEQICDGIDKTKPQVLLLVNPTYEGISLDLKDIVSVLRAKYPELIIFVDEAWGAHLQFSDKLPTSAMDAGADICVQSTHKQGGSLQQSGMIHWKDGRVHSELLIESYRSLGTSSPSYLLLASLDAARETMEKKGKEKIDHILKTAELLSSGIDKIQGFEVVSMSYLKLNYSAAYEKDETKVIVDVTGTGMNGYEVANILDHKYQIIAEAYNIRTILFLVPFRATEKDVSATLAALKKISLNPKTDTRQNLFTLKVPTNIPRILELNDVTKLLWNQVERIPLEQAVGRIAAEYITPFPPGIPLTMKGEQLTSEIIEYYQNLKAYPNVHIAAHDKTLERICVVK
jgi:arginine decarboxylase